MRRGNLKFQVSPCLRPWRGNLNSQDSPDEIGWRGILKIRFPPHKENRRGNLKNQVSASGGETYTLKGKIFPPQCVVMGVGMDGP